MYIYIICIYIYVCIYICICVQYICMYIVYIYIYTIYIYTYNTYIYIYNNIYIYNIFIYTYNIYIWYVDARHSTYVSGPSFTSATCSIIHHFLGFCVVLSIFCVMLMMLYLHGTWDNDPHGQTIYIYI